MGDDGDFDIDAMLEAPYEKEGISSQRRLIDRKG